MRKAKESNINKKNCTHPFICFCLFFFKTRLGQWERVSAGRMTGGWCVQLRHWRPKNSLEHGANKGKKGGKDVICVHAWLTLTCCNWRLWTKAWIVIDGSSVLFYPKELCLQDSAHHTFVLYEQRQWHQPFDSQSHKKRHQPHAHIGQKETGTKNCLSTG